MIVSKMSSKPMMGYAGRGFTLVELLLIIALVAMIAAILAPVFQPSPAHRSSCISNVKQCTLGVLQYYQDYDECAPSGVIIPAGQVCAGIRIPGRGWAGEVYPYLKNTQVYKCPDDPTRSDATKTPPWTAISYGMNRNVANKKAAGLVNSAFTVLLFEVTQNQADVTGYTPTTESRDWRSIASNGGDGGGAGYIDFCVPAGEVAKYDTGVMGVPQRFEQVGSWVKNRNAGRHEGAIFGFCDGHVKLLFPSRVSTGHDNSNSVCAQDYGGNPCTKVFGNAAGATTKVNENLLVQATFSTR